MNNDETTISVESGQTRVADCIGVVLVPENALAEPGYIRTMTANREAHAKHEFFAMAQMAYYQYQDDELELHRVEEPIVVTQEGTREEIGSGMVICRDRGGELQVLVHAALNAKRMLEAANRYCTRWVRLDI